ncbi:MAG TPA: PspA/IM30 family protein [Acidimicrobiales bacterium]|nr:PspA/IM30 family protein [Acidimicrobiales bacterium]
MGVFRRFLDVVRAKVNKLLDRVEDPRDTLDLSYEKQVENLQNIRRSVAEVATARKRIEMQAVQLEQQAGKLQDQARQALGQNREDLAREALTRRAAVGGQLGQLRAQQEQIADQEERLVETLRQLQAQVALFRTRKETMKATYTAAEAQVRVGEVAAGINQSWDDAGRTVERAQDKIAQMQARAGAIDELLASGALTDLSSSTDDIQARLDQVAASSQVDAELAALKSELASGASPGLPAGTPPSTVGAADAAAVAAASPDPRPPAAPPGPPGPADQQPEVSI